MMKYSYTDLFSSQTELFHPVSLARLTLSDVPAAFLAYSFDMWCFLDEARIMQILSFI